MNVGRNVEDRALSSSARGSLRHDQRAEADQRLCYVLDDESAIFPLIEFALTGAGYSCAFHDQFDSFVQGFEERHPDLVICDLALRNNDAIDVVCFLDAQAYRGIVLFISGIDGGALRKVQAAGIRHGLKLLPFARKPFRATDLRAILDENDACGPAHLSLECIDEALENGRFMPWYQPKVDPTTGVVVGAEALARMVHPDRGILKPAAFIEKLDKKRMIAFTQAMLTAVLADLPRFEINGQKLPVALNIPPAILHELNLGERLRNHAAQYGWRPELIIEMTETAIISDLGLVCDLATQCGIYGAELSIDDFGTGFSNLARLSTIPFDEIKIDSSLIRNCHTDVTDCIIVRAIIELAHNLGARTVAEGVEDAQTVQVLIELGCDLVQGYYFSRPVSAQEFVERFT